MDKRTLGSGDAALEVSAQGLGCMGMSEFYGASDEGDAIATIHRALELGVDFIDTADMYGPWTNEQLVGKAIANRRAWRTWPRRASGSPTTSAPGSTRSRRSARAPAIATPTCPGSTGKQHRRC
jgi:predicted aldo/keto reductase-like oxidoreductase